MTANGYLPQSSLTQVDGWAYLETGTADAWLAAASEVLAITGLRPIITSPIGAYRSYDQQVAIKAEFTAAGKGYEAAYPGTSNHGLGTAVDVYNISHYDQTQLDAIMARHGFVRDVTFESWHYHHTTTIPSDAAFASVGQQTLIPIIVKADDDMPKLIRNYDTSIGLITADGLLQPIPSMNEYESLLRSGLVTDFTETQADGTVWNALAARTVRIQSLGTGDTAAIAQAVAALVVPAITASLTTSNGLTATDVQTATEAAVKAIFAQAAK